MHMILLSCAFIKKEEEEEEKKCFQFELHTFYFYSSCVKKDDIGY